MHFLSTLFAASLLLSGAFAAPHQGEGELDLSNMVSERFVGSDGEAYEILVDRSFLSSNETEIETEIETELETEVSESSLQERQTGPASPTTRNSPKWRSKSSNQKKCKKSSYKGNTGPNAPTSGRCKAIRDWANKNKGYYSIGWSAITPGSYRALLVSRASGATTCFFSVYHDAIKVRIGNTDIKNLINESLKKYEKKTGGKYRVRASGNADCDGDFVQNGSAELKWRLT